MKNGKAPGTDGIPYEIYKYGTPTMVKILTSIMNKCMTQKIVPDEWKIGKIWMIFKSGNPYEPENYRPITLLNTSYKIYTKILYNRLRAVVEIIIICSLKMTKVDLENTDHVFKKLEPSKAQ